MKLFRDKKGFTGLEAAITLIAFITVAAVFSYILLGAGFFSTQKGQEVVHTGVQQVSSSVEIVGSVIAHGNLTTNKLTDTIFTIQLAAGGQPIDLEKTVITVTDPKNGRSVDLAYNETANGTKYEVKWITTVNFNETDEAVPDRYLEEYEKAQITIDLILAGFELKPNEVFLIEIKPPMGATYPLELKVPPTIDPTMVLLQ